MRLATLLLCLAAFEVALGQTSILFGGGTGDGADMRAQGTFVPAVLYHGGTGRGDAMSTLTIAGTGAQYFGGENDGYASSNGNHGALTTGCFGGNGHGAAVASGPLTIPAPCLGGSGDGYAEARCAQVNNTALWYGGTDDGSADTRGTVAFSSLRVVIKLEGPFDTGTGLMRDDLRASGLLPTSQPYTGPGYPLTSAEPRTITPQVLTPTGNDAIVDWLYLELRSATNSAMAITSIVALLQRDGDVVALDGSGPPEFRVPAGSYYLVVRHRNHLGVMTAVPMALSNAPQRTDLSASATSFYGTAATKTAGTVQVLWAGDVTGNGQLNYTGAGNDRDPILVTVGSTTPNATVTNVYSASDVNLDGAVKYTGASNDRDPILVNVGSTTPNNVRVQQVP